MDRFQKKIVIVPSKKDEEGKVVIKNWDHTPYGYHHLLGIYGDGSFWLEATVFCSVPVEKLGEIAKVINGDVPIEIDEDFYKKQKQA